MESKPSTGIGKTVAKVDLPTSVLAPGLHRYETVLLAKTPWEVIALRNAGIKTLSVCLKANDPLRDGRCWP